MLISNLNLTADITIINLSFDRSNNKIKPNINGTTNVTSQLYTQVFYLKLVKEIKYNLTKLYIIFSLN